MQIICYAQYINDLQQKKINAEKEIQLAARLLNQAQKEERASISRLQLLNNTISQRNLLISGLTSEISLYNGFIKDNILVADMLEEDIRRIKNEYARLIRLAYRNKYSTNEFIFLLSAENFNQAYRRFLYMRRYTSYRKKQSLTIELIQSLLNEKVNQLKQLKQFRQELIDETHRETQKLKQEKKRQHNEINELKKKQFDLQEKINQQRRIEYYLEAEIADEARISRKEGESVHTLTTDEKKLDENFELNKRGLPWPVERGIITEKFGIHPHPVLTNLKIRNNGINIATEIGAKVRAVFNGEISRVFGITGSNLAVIIRHGKYLTVYSNLKEVTVKKGDKVTVGQDLGTVFTDYQDAGKTILKFQIWHENQKLNPEEWIGQK